MASEVGSAFVSLIPSARGFSRLALRELRKALAGVRGEIPLTPQVDRTSATRAGRQASEDAQRGARPVQLPVEVDRRSLSRVLPSLAGLARTATLGAAGLAAIGAVGSSASAALAGVASAAAGLIPLLGQLVSVALTAAGALAAIPGALAIAGVAVGTLVIGSLGLGEALQEMSRQATGGGAAAANLGRQVERAARQVVLAERRVADAQRDALAAQEAVNRARADAAERLQDLELSLAAARLDEEAAVLALAEAREELASVREDPRSTLLDIQRADLAYRQSEQTLAEVRERLGDLTAEQADAARRGVEGSDEVQQALQRQRDAQLAVEDASYDLRQAQIDLQLAQQQTTAGAAAAATAMAALSPAAQALVRTLLGLRSAWDSVRLATQERLFAGVAGAVQRLATVSLPTLRAGLVGVAAVLNGVLLTSLAQLSTQAAQLRLAEIFDATRLSASRLGVAVQPLIQALLDVAAVGADVLSELTGPLGTLLSSFAQDLSAMAASGELRRLILEGLGALQILGAALLDIGGIIRGVFGAAGQAEGGGLFGLLANLNRLVNSAAGQGALTNLFAELSRIGDALMPVLLALGRGLGVVAGAIGDIAVATAPFLEQFLGLLADALARLAPGFIALGPAVVALGRGLAPLADILAQLVVGIAPGVESFLLALGEGLGILAPVAHQVGLALGEVLDAVAPLLPLVGVLLARALSQAAIVLAALVNGPGAALIELFARLATAFSAQLVPVMARLGDQLLPVFAEASERILAAFEPLIPLVQQIAQVFAARMATALPSLVDAFGDLVLAWADLAGPIGQALVQAVLDLAPQVPALADASVLLALALTDVLVALTPILPVLVRLLTLTIELIRAAARLVPHLRVMRAVARALAGPILSAANAVARFANAVRDRLPGVLGFFRDLPRRIRRAVGNIGRTLWNAGRDLIQGLIDGIWNRVRSLRDTLTSVTDLIPDWKGPLDRDRRLLRPAGHAIMAGLRRGFLDELPRVESTLGGITTDIATQVGAPSPGAAPAARVVVDGTGLPRALAEWLRHAVRTQGGGSVQRFVGQGVPS